MVASIHPLGEVVAGLELCVNLCRAHALVFGEVLRILPLEEFDAILGDCLAAEMAISSGLLVLGLAKRQGLSDRTRAAIKGNFDDVGDVYSAERSLLGAVCLHEEGQR